MVGRSLRQERRGDQKRVLVQQALHPKPQRERREKPPWPDPVCQQGGLMGRVTKINDVGSTQR